MEPIISPWVIYVLHIFDKLYIACRISLFISLTFWLLTVIGAYIEDDEDIKKINKILLKIAAISAIVLIIIPDKDTLIAMMATSYITPDNIHAAQENVVEFIRQISGAVQSGK